MSNTPTARADPDLIRDLTRRARHGDQHASGQLAAAANPTLRATIAAHAGVDADVDDLLQDTWVAALAALPNLPALHNPLGWLRGLARTTAVAAAYDDARRNSLISPAGRHLPDVPDPAPGPEQVALADTGRRRTRTATVRASTTAVSALTRHAHRAPTPTHLGAAS